MGLIHILIVDDDPALLQALPEALHLRLEGLKIDTAESAATALDLIAATDYDAIITDIKMPGMDGLTLLGKIKELCPATPTLLITGHGEHDLTVQALRGGAYDFIQKPIERDYLVASLNRAIEARRLSRQVEEQHLALERHAAFLEQTVQERTRELIEVNRTKDEFMRIAAHELHTPLTTLKLLTQLMRRQLERAGVPAERQFTRMEHAIARMEQLISDLLDVTRIEAGKLTLRIGPCQLQELCQQIIDEQAAATNRVITFSAPDDPVDVEIDADRIGQVITNLLSNALKYSAATTPVSLTLEQDGERVLLCVRDQGAGIPPEALPHIFDRFYQAPGIEVQSGSGIGLGLGLHICREIVVRHSGQIWAESTLGSGSAFYVALPIASPLRSESGQPADEPSAVPSQPGFFRRQNRRNQPPDTL
jgi:two-component system sensor histidine kinase/response regulator